MLAVEVIGAIVHLRIDVVVTAVVGEVLGPGVVGDELQAVGEAFINLGLKGIVVAGRVIAEEVNILRPAKSREEWSAIILREKTGSAKPTSVG